RRRWQRTLARPRWPGWLKLRSCPQTPLLINYYNVTAVTDHILEARWRQAAGVRSRVCSTCAWVGLVAQAIAEQVDRQHGGGDAQAGRDHLPRVVLEVACGFVDHLAQLGRRWLHAQSGDRLAAHVHD